MTDRPPPVYVNDDGEGFEEDGPGRAPICPIDEDPDLIPYWRPTGEFETHPGPFGPEEVEIYEVACRRGTRAYYGPWFLGSAPEDFDQVAEKIVVFENSDRLRLRGDRELREMDVSAEMYTHVGTHHGTCDISVDACQDASQPEYASSEQCDGFRQIAEQCPAPGPSTDCAAGEHGFEAFRITSARNGRYTMELPEGRGFPVVEDPMWLCQNHMINDEPPAYGSGSTRKRDFRRQENGAVGEMVLQMFTEPWTESDAEPVSVTFDFVAHGATTFIPPFTMATQETLWYAPFDLAVGMATLHSHENMVKGTMQVLPGTVPRETTNPLCGGSLDGNPNPDVYTNYDYFEPTVCEYWKDDDGPIILRKGQAIRASCITNNGVTPTVYLPDGVAAGIENSPVGREVLYGRQPPESYRVRYACEEIEGVPPGRPPRIQPRDCPPNPDIEMSQDPVEGPYEAPEHCPTNLGYTGRCVPANVVFANTAEDAMCIPIIMYWPLDRLVGSDGSTNEEAVDELRSGNVNEVGTPGRLWRSPSDRGTCHDNASGTGPHLDDPNPLDTNSRNCRAGL